MKPSMASRRRSGLDQKLRFEAERVFVPVNVVWPGATGDELMADYPFNPDITTPSIKYCWKKKKTNRTGRVINNAIAIIS
jgi:hypothetical protein